jgi:uncharacterized protein (TIGR00251 family)
MLVSHPDGSLLVVWVVPGARRSEVVGPHGDAVKIRVAAPAEGGRANRAMLSVLSERIGADCRLESGATHRRKSVVVKGVGPGEVAASLGIEPPRGADDEEVPR